MAVGAAAERGVGQLQMSRLLWLVGSINYEPASYKSANSQAKPSRLSLWVSCVLVRIGSVWFLGLMKMFGLPAFLPDYFYLSLSIFGMWWETQIYCASNYLKTHSHTRKLTRAKMYLQRVDGEDTVSFGLQSDLLAASNG